MADPSVQVRFHRSLYRPEAVDEAVRAFADLAKVTVLHNPDDTLVVIEALPGQSEAERGEIPMIANELANFALSETVARSRQVAS